MKPILDNRRCLRCGKSLDGTIETSSWHASCSRAFFGTSAVPSLDATSRSLESLARIAVGEGMTVTGAQKKMSVRLEGESGRKRLTLVGYPTGFILKPPVPEYPDLPELEHALMSLAETAGIDAVPHALIRMATDEIAYITRRIDRSFPASLAPPIKIHMEDFCQLSGRLTEDKYKGSYEQCGKIIARYSARPGLDMANFFFLILFCFVTGNADMHLKNFSFLDSPSGYVLAPAYDLVPTNLLLADDDEETALTINGKKKKISSTDFLALGESLGLRQKVIENLMLKARSIPDDFSNAPAVNLLPVRRRDELANLIAERRDRLT